jgi:aminomethyltransferase
LILHTGGTANYMLRLPSGIVRGSYQLQLIDPDKRNQPPTSTNPPKLKWGKGPGFSARRVVRKAHAFSFLDCLPLPAQNRFAMSKKTPFTHIHESLGAKMAPFAGYLMPISYSGINEEHATVRQHAGVFDVSHMGEFVLKGPHALDLIQRVTSNDASKLTKGKAQYSCLPNETGGIVDDLLVYCLEENQAYMLVVNASNIEKDWNWISERNTQGVEMYNISDKTCLLAVQGPKASQLVQELTDLDVLNLKYYTFAKGVVAGVENVLVSATGYTGAGGVEIYFEDKGDDAERIWKALFDKGAAYGLKPIGLGARDTLRLEMGFCLYGNDIDDTTSPMEAGLGWITKFTKDFTNRSTFEAQKTHGVAKKLVGFELVDKGIARHDYPIVDAAGQTIGRVTSGTMSPSLGKAIGLGYVDAAHAALETEIFIQIRQQAVRARVVKVPFA